MLHDNFLARLEPGYALAVKLLSRSASPAATSRKPGARLVSGFSFDYGKALKGILAMSLGTILLIILVIILLGGFSGLGGGPFYGTGYYGGGGLGLVVVILLILVLMGRI